MYCVVQACFDPAAYHVFRQPCSEGLVDGMVQRIVYGLVAPDLTNLARSGCYKNAIARSCLDHTRCLENSIGTGDGVRIDEGVGGRSADRRQAFSFAGPPGGHGHAHLLGNLVAGRDRASCINPELHGRMIGLIRLRLHMETISKLVPTNSRAAVRRAALLFTYILAVAAAAGPMAGCSLRPPLTVQDLRGRRVVEVDRPVTGTEFYEGRRVFLVQKSRDTNGPAGFTLTIEYDDAALAPDGELQFDFPNERARVSLVVAGDRGRVFQSRAARGTVRLREFAQTVTAAVDLEFKKDNMDPTLIIPEYIFIEDGSHLRITGAFEAEK